MKRLIAVLMTSALVVTLFSPALMAGQWDPSNPPVYPWKENVQVRPEVDEGGWNTRATSPRPSDSGDMYLLSYWVVEFVKVYILDVREIDQTADGTGISENSEASRQANR